MWDRPRISPKLLWIPLAIILLDHAAKFIVITSLPGFHEIKFGIFRFGESRNYDWAFGLGHSSIPSILLFGDIIAATVILIAKSNYKNKLLVTALALFLGGLVSTCIDRIFRGYVVDYVSIAFGPYFNLADVAGFSVLAVLNIMAFQWFRSDPTKNNKKTTATGNV